MSAKLLLHVSPAAVESVNCKLCFQIIQERQAIKALRKSNTFLKIKLLRGDTDIPVWWVLFLKDLFYLFISKYGCVYGFVSVCHLHTQLPTEARRGWHIPWSWCHWWFELSDVSVGNKSQVHWKSSKPNFSPSHGAYPEGFVMGFWSIPDARFPSLLRCLHLLYPWYLELHLANPFLLSPFPPLWGLLTPVVFIITSMLTNKLYFSPSEAAHQTWAGPLGPPFETTLSFINTNHPGSLLWSSELSSKYAAMRGGVFSLASLCMGCRLSTENKDKLCHLPTLFKKLHLFLSQDKVKPDWIQTDLRCALIT
jgi:hypothetical protein